MKNSLKKFFALLGISLIPTVATVADNLNLLSPTDLRFTISCILGAAVLNFAMCSVAYENIVALVKRGGTPKITILISSVFIIVTTAISALFFVERLGTSLLITYIFEVPTISIFLTSMFFEDAAQHTYGKVSHEN